MEKKTWNPRIIDPDQWTKFAPAVDALEKSPDADRAANHVLAKIRYRYIAEAFEVDDRPCLRRVIKQTKRCGCATSRKRHYGHLKLDGVSDHSVGLTRRKDGRVYYFTQPYRLSTVMLCAATRRETPCYQRQGVCPLQSPAAYFCKRVAGRMCLVANWEFFNENI